MFRCVFEATSRRGYDVRFKDPVTQRAYEELEMEEAGKWAAAEGRRWLAERKLDVGLPVFHAGVTRLDDYARAVEAHCSVEPGSALQPLAEDTLTVRPEFLQKLWPDIEAEGDKFTCLMNVLAASDMASGGVRFGFVGNEAYLEDKKH